MVGVESGGGTVIAEARRPVDASMDLLNEIVRQPYDPDYAIVTARGLRPARFRVGLALILLLVGAMFAVSALQTTRGAPEAERQRMQLIDRVNAAQQRQDELRGQATRLTEQNAALRQSALGNTTSADQTRSRLDALSLAAGGTAVTGPGLTFTLDDAPNAAVDSSSAVTAQDVQVLVNSLWRSGAEAISINGHRLSTLTAIRQAGTALTVDYASITHPYVVEAIGDPRSFAATFAQSSGASWWETLKNAQQMRYDQDQDDELSLVADSGLTLRYAERPDDDAVPNTSPSPR